MDVFGTYRETVGQHGCPVRRNNPATQVEHLADPCGGLSIGTYQPRSARVDAHRSRPDGPVRVAL